MHLRINLSRKENNIWIVDMEYMVDIVDIIKAANRVSNVKKSKKKQI